VFKVAAFGLDASVKMLNCRTCQSLAGQARPHMHTQRTHATVTR